MTRSTIGIAACPTKAVRCESDHAAMTMTKNRNHKATTETATFLSEPSADSEFKSASIYGESELIYLPGSPVVENYIKSD